MPSPFLRRPYALFLALGVLVAGCSGEPHGPRTIALAECRLPGLDTAVQCGTVEVPENRAQPEGRRIEIFVALLPANTLTPRPDPLVILAGGPGQAATSLATFASRLIDVRRSRDIVLVDQRGTGRSTPLDCEAFAPDEDPAEAVETDPAPRAKRCIDELAARGTDVRQYTTAASIADLEALREALGYARWNLWGGSYGSRVALEYLRHHRDRVRAMVLDGVASPSLKVASGVWITRDLALDAVFDACAASAACRDRHPDLHATLNSVADQLGPAGRKMEVADPRTGRTQSLTLSFDAVLAALYPLTYAPELAAAIPAILQRAADGDFAPLLAFSQMVNSNLAEQMNVALHFAVTCSEDAPRVDAADRARLAAQRSESLALQVLAVCDFWPRGTPGADFARPVESDAPVLLLSGGLDPVTPPAYADEVRATLPNSRHVVAGGYGHIVSPHACGPRLIAAFIDRAGFDSLPRSCIDHFTHSSRPPMWVNHLAPLP